MPVHHDKAAYGKLASMRESVSDEAIAKMAQELMRSEEEEQDLKEPCKKEKDGGIGVERR